MDQPIKVASAPFDKPIATSNLILLSSDRVHFHVSKDVLILSSSFFRDMLSLKQPTENDLPIVPVSEDSKTLDYLLRLCYPIIPPSPLSDLSDVSKALGAAIKYDMDKCTWTVKKELHNLGEADPPRMFAIACQLQLEDEAVAAAKMWRDQKQGRVPYHRLLYRGYRQEMAQISAGSLRRFLLYVQTGSSNVPLCHSSTTITKASVDGDDDDTTGETSHNSTVDLGTIYNATPDTIVRSADGVDILVHRTTLYMVSPTNTLLPTTAIESTPPDGMQVVECDEDGIVLVKLLQLCYPFGDNRFANLITQMKNTKTIPPFEQDVKVYDASIKYQLGDDVKEAAFRKVSSHIDSNPLKVFFIAVSLKRRVEAQNAAKAIIERNPIQQNFSSAKFLKNLYDESMECDGSATHYRDLIAYVDKHHTIDLGGGNTTATAAFAMAKIPASVVFESLREDYEEYRKGHPWGPQWTQSGYYGQTRAKANKRARLVTHSPESKENPSSHELAFADTLELYSKGLQSPPYVLPSIELQL